MTAKVTFRSETDAEWFLQRIVCKDHVRDGHIVTFIDPDARGITNIVSRLYHEMIYVIGECSVQEITIRPGT